MEPCGNYYEHPHCWEVSVAQWSPWWAAAAGGRWEGGQGSPPGVGLLSGEAHTQLRADPLVGRKAGEN